MNYSLRNLHNSPKMPHRSMLKKKIPASFSFCTDTHTLHPNPFSSFCAILLTSQTTNRHGWKHNLPDGGNVVLQLLPVISTPLVCVTFFYRLTQTLDFAYVRSSSCPFMTLFTQRDISGSCDLLLAGSGSLSRCWHTNLHSDLRGHHNAAN